MNITELKNKINSLNLFDNFPNINGYSISLKEKNGKITDDLCIQFYVKEKKNLNDLKPEEIIPKSLSAFDIEIITDVVEQAEPHLLSSLPNDNSIDSLTAVTNDILPSNYDTIHNVNYFKYRPLRGGISSVELNSGDATLGLLVRDVTDDSVVALSNNHVYASSQFSGLSSIFGKNSNTLNLSARQPGSYYNNAYGEVTSMKDCIGIHKRCVAMKFGTTAGDDANVVDCSITQLTNYNLIDSSSVNVNGFNQTGPYEFATTEEIDSLIDPSSPNYQAYIFRSGRTLGPIGYPGSLYTNRFTVSSVSTPRRMPIQNIKSIKYICPKDYGESYNQSYMGSTYILKYKEVYGTEQGLLVETTDGDVYRSGYMANIPKQPQTLADFVKIGNFSYFNYSTSATFGISANKLVFFSSPNSSWFLNNAFYPVGYNWKCDKNLDGYVLAPQQLTNYNDVKKIIISEYGNFILTNSNVLYTIGINDDHMTLGYETNPKTIPAYGTNGTVASTWTRVPGQWKNIEEVALGEFVALSSSGELFYTAPPICAYDKPATVTRFVWNFTHSWNLTANKISNHKFKEIYSTGDWLSSVNLTSHLYRVYPGLALSASGGKLAHIGIFNGNFVYSFAGGTWPDDIKVVENENKYAGLYTKLILSNNELYNSGYSLHPSMLPRHTSFFNQASSYNLGGFNYPSTNFSKISNVNVSNIVGFGYDPLLYKVNNRPQESIIYLSGGVWYCNGLSPMNIFPLNDLSRDRIVITSVAYSTRVTVNGVKNGIAPLWYDCLRMVSYNNDFKTSRGGDSGSAVFALLSANIPSLSAWKVIGLNFASNPNYGQNWAAVCRIDNVAELLNVKPWDGVIPSTKSKIDNRSFPIPEQRRSYTNYVYISGRKYYNIGTP